MTSVHPSNDRDLRAVRSIGNPAVVVFLVERTSNHSELMKSDSEVLRLSTTSTMHQFVVSLLAFLLYTLRFVRGRVNLSGQRL